MTDELRLAGEFPAPTRDQWLALVDKVLKGAPFDKKLVSTTADGIAVQPLYTAADVAAAHDESGFPGRGSLIRGSHPAPRPGGGWDIRAEVVHPDPAVAATRAVGELEQGATSLELRFDAAFRAGGTPGGAGGDAVAVDGVAVWSADALDRALDGVYLDLAPLALQPGAGFVTAAGWLAEVWARRGLGGAQLSGSLGADPIGALAATGILPQGLDAALADLGELAGRTAAATPLVRAVSIDTAAHVGAGASDAQELAAFLATGVAYLRAMEGAGVPLDVAVTQIGVVLGADADVFSTVAKLRAARRLWSAVAEACGLGEGARAIPFTVRPAGRMMTRRDPWVNMLRVTAATFGAVLGGADTVITAPFDVVVGGSGVLGPRVARNTQLLLAEESHLGEVLDAPGGSWYLESLTDELAAAAWARFQDLERAGGMAAALTDGSWAAALAGTWNGRLAALATRREPVTGVSEFPDLAEEPVEPEVIDRDAVRASVGAAAPSVAAGTPTTVEPLPAHRLAEGYEALRDASDAALARDGQRPRVFLANLGPVAVHTARATFAKNLFEAGGIEAVGDEGYADDAAVVAAYEASGASLAVICSSDAVYAERAAATAKALAAAGATRVYLAGNPGEHRDEWTAAGVGGFVHVGVDVLDVLRTAQRLAGVTS